MKRSKQFYKINIEISNICNLQCSFCPEVLRPKQVMELKLFEKIIEQVAPLTDQVCLHLMGDPLVHPHLDQIIAACERQAVPIFLVSNGLLMREKQQQLLLSPILRQVNFSLHSFPDNFPGKDSTPYLNRIFHFIEAAFEQRPELYLNLRLWNLQAPQKNNGANLEMLQKIESYFQWKCPSEIDIRRQKSARICNRLYLHFDSQFVWPSLELPVLGTRGTCYGLDSHIGILVDGTVVPCCLDKEGVISLGNISQQKIENILAGSRASSMRFGFKQNILREDLCQRCQYIERFQGAKKF